MKKLLTIAFIALLAMGINHAESLAEVQTVDAQHGDVHRGQPSYRLVNEDQRTALDPQRSSGSTGRAEVTGENEPNPAFKSYSKAAAVSPKVDHDCPCGPDCNCPDPMVCKNGDCKKNYVVFLTAKWCGPCRTMYPRIKELREAGYIVYVFDVDEYKQTAAKLNVEKLPTTVVIDDGKEVARFIGVVEKEKITNIAKTKEEQERAKPFDYDFR